MSPLDWISAQELYAIIAGLVLGWSGTEAVKRMMRLVSRRSPAWLYPLLGYLITAAGTYATWPADGKFPHRVIAAMIVGLIAPTIYKLLTAWLRKSGLHWVANAISGERRHRKAKPPDGVERRQPK